MNAFKAGLMVFSMAETRQHDCILAPSFPTASLPPSLQTVHFFLLLMDCYKSDSEGSEKCFPETSQPTITGCLTTSKLVHKDPRKISPQIVFWPAKNTLSSQQDHPLFSSVSDAFPGNYIQCWTVPTSVSPVLHIWICWPKSVTWTPS